MTHEQLSHILTETMRITSVLKWSAVWFVAALVAFAVVARMPDAQTPTWLYVLLIGAQSIGFGRAIALSLEVSRRQAALNEYVRLAMEEERREEAAGK